MTPNSEIDARLARARHHLREVDATLGDVQLAMVDDPEDAGLHRQLEELRATRAALEQTITDLERMKGAAGRRKAAQDGKAKAEREAARTSRRAELEAKLRESAPALLNQVLALGGPVAELCADIGEHRRLVAESLRAHAGHEDASRLALGLRRLDIGVGEMLGRALYAAFGHAALDLHGVAFEPPLGAAPDVETCLDKAFGSAARAIELAKTPQPTPEEI